MFMATTSENQGRKPGTVIYFPFFCLSSAARRSCADNYIREEFFSNHPFSINTVRHFNETGRICEAIAAK
jgi:hypothetical protein